MRPLTRFLALGVVGTALLGACSNDKSNEPVTLRLLAYNSFPAKDTSLNAALADFTKETGIGVDIVIGGDAGTMVTKAVLTSGNPEGDVMWGVDNTLLSRALDANVFVPYKVQQGRALAPDLTALVPNDEVTPVDFGDVCINYDVKWFADHGLQPPTSLKDLTDPAYRNLLTVEHPASSSTGLAFLLATIAAFGPDGWQSYWADLRTNGVEVVADWDSVYYERFSGSSGAGPRPLVVSYGTSPPAEVLFAEPPRTDAPTASLPQTCFRQVEFAGILRGTDHKDAAGKLMDFLASAQFQSEIALNLFVYPSRTDVELPEAFFKYSSVPDDPYTVDPASIAANREAWVDEWTQIVLR